VIADMIKPDGVKTHLLNHLRSLCTDKSWRVRYMVADKFVNVFFLTILTLKLAKIVGSDIIKQELIKKLVISKSAFSIIDQMFQQEIANGEIIPRRRRKTLRLGNG
jgi:hypothetical protein